MENQSKKPEHRLNHLLYCPTVGDYVQEALDIIEDLQKLSYSRAAGENGFTLADSRCLLDKAAVYLYDARSAIARQMALDDEEG